MSLTLIVAMSGALVVVAAGSSHDGAISSERSSAARVIESTSFDVLAAQGFDSDSVDLDSVDVVATDRARAEQQRWLPGVRVEFLVNEDGAPDGAAEAIVSAAASWQRTGLDVEFEHVGSTDAAHARSDLDNVVSWIDTPDDRDVFVARTTTYWYADQPDVIIGFDLTFNRDHAFVVGSADDAWDIETIALHELGHVLGLAHADPERVLQIMRPRIESGDVDRSLSLRDIGAIAERYGIEDATVARGFFVRHSGQVDRWLSSGGAGVDQEPTTGLFG